MFAKPQCCDASDQGGERNDEQDQKMFCPRFSKGREKEARRSAGIEDRQHDRQSAVGPLLILELFRPQNYRGSRTERFTGSCDSGLGLRRRNLPEIGAAHGRSAPRCAGRGVFAGDHLRDCGRR